MMLRLGRENGSIILSQFFGFINFLHIYLCHLVQFLQSFLVEFQCRDPPEPLGLWHLDLILSFASEKRKKITGVATGVTGHKRAPSWGPHIYPFIGDF